MPIVYKENYDFRIGQAISLKNGKEICILATGSLVSIALKTAEELEALGISTAVMDVHTIKPFDDKIRKEAVNYRLIVTAEEHSVIGGIGSAAAEALSGYPYHPPLLRIGIEGEYPHGASYSYLMEINGLTKDKMTEKIVKKYREIEMLG